MYLTIVRRRGRELVHTEILLCARSQAKHEMQINVQMWIMKLLLGEPVK